MPDAIILECHKAGFNGLEPTRLIRQRAPSLAGILFTAYFGDIKLDDAKREEDFKILTKEIELESLRTVIHHAKPHRRQ